MATAKLLIVDDNPAIHAHAADSGQNNNLCPPASGLSQPEYKNPKNRHPDILSLSLHRPIAAYLSCMKSPISYILPLPLADIAAKHFKIQRMRP
jgi:hypothetical protein